MNASFTNSVALKLNVSLIEIVSIEGENTLNLTFLLPGFALKVISLKVTSPLFTANYFYPNTSVFSVFSILINLKIIKSE